MATDEEIFALIAKVQGADDVKRLARETEEAEQQLRDLIATQKAMGPAGAQMASMVRDQAAALHGLQDQLKAAERASGMLGGSTRNTGQAILEGSRALEDLQYGLAGVLNNIPSLIQSLGGPAGLAGVISLVAVGATQLYKHWDDLAEIFGQAHTKTEAERMKDLADQTEKTAAETKKLADYERNRASAKSVITGQSKDESDRSSAVESAFKEAGGEKVLGLIRDFAGKQVGNSAPEEMVARRARAQEEVDRLTAKKDANGGSLGRIDQFRMDSATKERDAAESALAKRVDKWIEDYLGEIPNNPKALDAFIGKVQNVDGELASSLREARKTSSDKEEEAYEAWRTKQEEEYHDRLAKSQIAGDEAALAEEAKYEAWRIGQEQGYQEKLAKSQVDGDEKAAKEEEEYEKWRLKQEQGYQEKFAKSQTTDARLGNAKESSPELANLLTGSIESAVRMGGNIQEAQGALFGDLANRFGEDMARAMLNDAGGNARQGLIADMLNGVETPKAVQVLQGGSALRDSIQSAVKADEKTEKLIRQAEITNGLLRDILRDGGGLG